MNGPAPPNRMTLADALRQGWVWFRQGELDRAEALAREIVRQTGANVDALHMQGLVAYRRDRLEEAERLIGEAHRLNPDNAEVLVNLGTVYRARKRIDLALSCYDRALALTPDNVETLNNRANVLRTLGRHAEALASFERALQIKPDYLGALSNRGLVLVDLGRHDEAIASYRRALEVSPGHVPTLYNHANALKAMERLEEALSVYDQVVAAAPRHADAFCNRGNTLKALQRLEAALDSYDRTLALIPDHLEGTTNRAAVLIEMGRHDDAEAGLRRVLARTPEHLDALNNLGLVETEKNRFEAALQQFDRILAIKPDHFEALNNRGNALREMQRWDEALAFYDRALAAKPDHADAHNNKGLIFKALKRWDEAIACFEKARQSRANFAQAHMNEALCRLQMGDFAAGWREYEWRWDSHDFQARARNSVRPFPTIPLRADARRILVWGEQGVGDAALYASMLPDLAARGADVTLELDPRLVKLFARSFPGFTVVPRSDPPQPQTAGPFDSSLPIASLGQYLRPEVASFPRHGGYLLADRDRAAALRRRYLGDSDDRLIGISWRSAARSNAEAKSSDLLAWAPILRLPKTRFVSLQYGRHANEIAEVRRQLGVEIIDDLELDQLQDLDDLACQIAAVDQVVSISNSAAHFAGAMAAPTLVLLPKVKGLHWYWFVDRSDNPWYPSMKMLRQDEAGEWSGVIAAAARELATPAAPTVPLPAAPPKPVATPQLAEATPPIQPPRPAEPVRAPSPSRDKLSGKRSKAADPARLFNQGVALHRQGKNVEASARYREVLALQPQHAGALNLSGVIASQRGAHAEAVDLIERALVLQPDNADFHNNLGMALAALNRHEDALRHFQRVCSLDPTRPDPFSQCGRILLTLGRIEAALASYDQALKLAPRHNEAAIGRATILNQLGRHDESLTALDAVLARDPGIVTALNSRGVTLIDMNRFDAALASFSRVLARQPGHFGALYNGSNALRQLERYDEALSFVDQALRVRPGDGDTHNSKGMILWAQRRWNEALAAFAQARASDATLAEAHLNEALCRLQMGDFENGWPAYDWRWKAASFQPQSGRRPRPTQLLRPDSKSALIWSEQGVGDSALYASMLPDLASRGISVTLEVEPRLVRLFTRSFPEFEVVPQTDPPRPETERQFDAQLPIASLGQSLRSSAAHFPRHKGYLKADPERAVTLRRRWLAGSSDRLIGIAWHSTAPRTGEPKTSQLRQWAPILRLPHTRFVSLQYGDRRQELADVRRELGVDVIDDPEIDQLRDLDDLAAQIAAVDSVVSISNSTAHFAGAMGAPTLVLLPRVRGLHWYWFVDRSDNPWYPSMKMLRQDEAGEWSGVIARAAALLEGNQRAI